MTDDGGTGIDGLVAGFESLLPASEFDGWPAEVLESDLRALLATDPSSVAWLAAPTGRALGYRVSGRDDGAFASELVDHVGRMLGPNPGDVLGELVQRPGDRTLELEHLFGDPNWYRVGLSFDEFDDLERMLAVMNAPSHARDRSLRYEGVDGADLRAFSLVVAGQRRWSYATAVALAPSVEDRPEGPAVGDGPVTVERTLRDWRATWIRRSGLDGEELADAGDEVGVGDAAGTVDEVHDALGVAGPDALACRRTDPAGTLAYVYEDPVDVG